MRDVSQPEEIVMGMSQQNRSNFSARRSLLPWGRGKSRNFGTEAPKGALKATAVGLLKQNSSSVHRFIRVAFFCPKSNGWSPDISRIAVKKSRQIQPRPETRCARPGCVCQLQPWGCWGILEPLGQLGPEFWDVYVCLWLVISYDALRCFGCWNDLTLITWNGQHLNLEALAWTRLVGVILPWTFGPAQLRSTDISTPSWQS